MPRASGAELSNRHLLAGLRVQKEAFTMPPKQWCFLLANALTNINFTPYQQSDTFTSPAIRFFGNASLAQNPQFYGHYMTEITECYETEDALLAGVKKADDILAHLRQQHNAQRWKEESGHEDPVFSPGDIVMARYRPRPGKEFAHKLARRFKFKFSVVYCRGTTCWVRPFSQSSIQKWAAAVDMSKRARESNLILPTYKVDTTDLVRISHGVHLYNTNQRKMHYSEFSAEKPKEVEFEALQPIQLAPSIFAPERHRDTYSEYEDPKNSFGPNYDGEEGEDEEWYEEDMEQQLTGASQNVYYYDSDDELRVRGGRENRGKGPRINRIKKHKEGGEPDQQLSPMVDTQVQQSSGDEIPQANSILRRHTLPIGERLARLAGYTLTPGGKGGYPRKTDHRVRFHPKVMRLDWRGRIEEDLQDTKIHPVRLLNKNRPANHPLTASINYLDAQTLPQDLWSNVDLLGCRCNKCNTREQAHCGDQGEGGTCPDCSYYPPLLWD